MGLDAISMKNSFKKGDLVKHKNLSEWGVGKVVGVDTNDALADDALVDDALVRVVWGQRRPERTTTHFPEYLEFAETPIERMKRRYSEEV